MINNKFLDIDGLKALLRKIDNRYKNIDEIRIDAGLKFVNITNNIINGVLTVSDGDGYFHQGRYYYCLEPIEELKFGPYKADDPNIMGESRVYIITKSTIPDKTISVSNTGDKWIWFDNKSILSADSNSLITVCTNQQGIFLADLKSYSAPNQTDIINKDYIKVTYNWSRGSKNNKPFNDEWLNKLSNCTVYYSSTGSGANNIGIDDLKAGLDVPDSTSGNPYIIIEFINDTINLEKLLYNIDFDTFNISLGSSKTVNSIKYAFGGNKSCNASGILLGNLTSDNCSFTSMEGLFENRQCGNIAFPSKLENVKSIKRFLKGNKLFNNSSILNGLSLKNCVDFYEAFNDCIGLTNATFLSNDGWKCYAKNHESLICDGMFCGTGLSDIGAVYNWINWQISYATESIKLSGLFRNCTSITDASNNTDSFITSLDGKEVDLSYMFYGCNNLLHFPVLIIKDIYKLNCDSMFSNINGKSGKSFENFKYWDLNANDEDFINKEVSFENMFKNTSFDLFEKGTKFIFGNAHDDNQNSGSKFNLHSMIKNDKVYFSGMFSNTCTSKYYDLYLGIYSSIYNEKVNGVIEWDSDLTSDMLDYTNMTNGGCYYIYSPARGRMSWIYMLIRKNYESWNLMGIKPYYNTDI